MNDQLPGGHAPLPMSRLSCGHYQRVTIDDARNHSPVWCLTCRNASTPRVVLLREWHVVCSDCPWHRWTGQLKWEARKAKERHASGPNFRHMVRMDYAVIPGMEYALISPVAEVLNLDERFSNDDPHLF